MDKYIVERISDGKLLELELPIEVESSSQRVSAPGVFSGTIRPDVGSLRDAHGNLLVDQRKSFIHLEADGVIRGTWLVTRASFNDDWEIDAAGFSTYPFGTLYEDDYRGVRVDLAETIRHIWAHVQRFQRSDLGITVTVNGSPKALMGVVRGTDSDIKADAAKVAYEVAKANLKEASDRRKTQSALIKKTGAPFDRQIEELKEQQKPLKEAYQVLIDARKPLIAAHSTLTKQRTARRELYKALVNQKNPPASDADIAAAKAQVAELAQPIADAKALVDARKPAIEAAKVPLDAKNSQIRVVRANKVLALEPLRARYDQLVEIELPLKQPVKDAKKLLDAAKEQQQEDGGAWKILAADLPDCGDEIQNCLTESGWEYIEVSRWNSDRTKILKEIRLMQSVGRRRTQQRFIEGDNIIDKVIVETPDTEFSNAVVVVGAGEGAKALRGYADVMDGRVRTQKVIDAKSVTKQSVLNAIARNEAAWRSLPLTISDIRVDATHPNALRGTFDLGDIILVDCELSWIGRVQLWRRIDEIEWVDENTADLKLGAAT